MVVLSKKRIIFVLSIVFISVFTFLLGTNKRTTDAVQVVGLPVSNKVVIIDAGHGLPDRWGRIK